jgi:hypothetical protein
MSDPKARVCALLPRVRSSTNSGFSMGGDYVATNVQSDTCENSLGTRVGAASRPRFAPRQLKEDFFEALRGLVF